MKLALCMIVAPTDEEATQLERCLGSVANFVDEIVITITGQNEQVEKVCKKFHTRVSHFDWIDDFSVARTFNFNQTQAEWILWLDADDTLDNGKNLKPLIAQAEANKVGAFFVLYKYGFDTNGNCIDQHWKINLVKNNGAMKWEAAIHEDLLGTAKIARTQDIVRVHHDTENRIVKSWERNERILLKEHEKKPQDPRPIFYLGRTALYGGKYQEAVDYLQEYLGMSGWDDERYEANLLIGEALMKTDQWDEALLTYNQAILEKEVAPDAYYHKGVCYMHKEDWNAALYNFQFSLNLPTNESTMLNPMIWTRDVYTAIGECYLNLGKLKDSVYSFQLALKADPQNKELLENVKFAVMEKDKYETAERYVRLAKTLDQTGQKDQIKTLLHTIPAYLQDNELILGLRNAFLKPKTWVKNSLVVFCGVSAETWTPKSLNNGGVGGSETAVIELTRRLVKKGWQITIFNQCDAPPEGMEIEGVRYENYWKFNINDTFDALWVWRQPALFDYDLKARLKILDLHDVMAPTDFTTDRIKAIDKIFVKTKYHRSLYPQIPDEKFVIINNGIDLKRFEGKAEKEPYRFCYTSSPNRGLDILLDMWPKIKEKLPQATLHVYYGWNTFYKLEKNNPERMMWMKKMQEKMKLPGVVDHGRLGQQELAAELLKTSFWLYPTYFPEISCITAMEMQAAGVVPITSGFAALAETQQSGIKLEGDVYDPVWQEKYINLVVTAKPQDTTKVAKQFSWDLVADDWNLELGVGGVDNAEKEG